MKGHSWAHNGSSAGVVLDGRAFATGPTPIVIADDVLYRAVETWPAPYRWPQGFGAVMLSCNLSGMKGTDERVMQANQWQLTQPLAFDAAWLPKSFPTLTAPGFLEGNAVILPPPTPSGAARVLNVLRFNSDPLANLAVVLELDLASQSLHFLSIIDLPGGMSKFTIRYHAATASYVTLSNPVPSGSNTTWQRDRLHWYWTDDVRGLTGWKEGGLIAWDDTGLSPEDSLRYTGFQYVDWQFDEGWPRKRRAGSCTIWNCEGGNDIIAAIRTAYRGANSYHNSNRLTYKRINNVTALIRTSAQHTTRSC